jgi:hypothetical protein
VNGDSEANKTSLVRVFDIVDGFVWLKLHPLDLCGVLFKEFSDVTSVEANIHFAFEL